MLLLTAAIAAVILLHILVPDSNTSAFVDGQQLSKMRRTFALQVGRHDQIYPAAKLLQRRPVSSDLRFGNNTMVLACAGRGPSRTASCLTTIVAKSNASVGGYRPSGFSKARHPSQHSLDTSRTQLLYDTAAAKTSTKPLVREETDFFTPDGKSSAVATALRVYGIAPMTSDGPFTPQVETQTVVATFPGSLTSMVITPPPRTTVSTFEATVVTVWTTFPATTVVATSNGVTITSVFTPPPQPALETVDGSVATIVQTKPLETRVMTASGSVVTLVAVITPGAAPKKPTTETVVSLAGGTATTLTHIATPLQPITTAIRTTVNGSLTTVSLTLIPLTTALVTTNGGIPTTMSVTLTLTPTTDFGIRTNRSNDSLDSGTRVYTGVTPTQYFSGTFLPPLLAVLLAFPISIIQLNVKLFQPFAALSAPGGATGPNSMTLRYAGANTIVIPFRQLLQGQPLPFLASLLMWLSWLVAPLASEAIGFKVHGVCSHLSISGCTLAIGVSPWPVRALIAVMSIMLVLLAMLAILLRRWDTGVYHNPWSLAAITLLSRHPNLRSRLAQAPSHTELSEVGLAELFRHGRFHLERSPLTDSRYTEDNQCDSDGDIHGYSFAMALAIIPHWESSTLTLTSSDYRSGKDTNTTTHLTIPPQRYHTPFQALTYSARTFFILLLLGLMALLCYYHLSHGDTSFELFMDSQTFGVRFFFAALGSLVALFWSSFFLSLGALTPFRCLSDHSRSTYGSGPVSGTDEKNVEVDVVSSPPPTNPATGVYFSLCHRQWLLLLTALMALTGELLPAFLANVPYSLTLTWNTHRACTYATLAILGAMVVVLGASMCISWPHMPVDPRTVAGMVYYVTASEELCKNAVRTAGKDTVETSPELDGKYFIRNQANRKQAGDYC